MKQVSGVERGRGGWLIFFSFRAEAGRACETRRRVHGEGVVLVLTL